jgi:ABC-type ATPase involved in cell division
MKQSEVPYLRRTLELYSRTSEVEVKTSMTTVAFAMRIVGASPKRSIQRVSYVLDLWGFY